VQKYHITTRYYNIYTKTDVAQCAMAFLKFLRTVLHQLPLKTDVIPIFQKKKRKKATYSAQNSYTTSVAPENRCSKTLFSSWGFPSFSQFFFALLSSFSLLSVFFFALRSTPLHRRPLRSSARPPQLLAVLRAAAPPRSRSSFFAPPRNRSLFAIHLSPLRSNCHAAVGPPSPSAGSGLPKP